MAVVVRAARAEDQEAIVRLVRGARINPRGLRWERFLVAEDGGRVVGVRQVKVHSGGTREVASGAVLPAFQHRGISARLMDSLLAMERGPLYLLCDRRWTAYYERFGFRQVEPATLPADLRREYRIGRTVTAVASVFALRGVWIVPMRRESEAG